MPLSLMIGFLSLKPHIRAVSQTAPHTLEQEQVPPARFQKQPSHHSILFPVFPCLVPMLFAAKHNSLLTAQRTVSDPKICFHKIREIRFMQDERIAVPMLLIVIRILRQPRKLNILGA